MKEVIVFYIPTSTLTTNDSEQVKTMLDELRGTMLSYGFHIIMIEDPTRDKIETEVFYRKKE